MENLTPRQVQEYLRKNDIVVSEEQAANILRFMSMMADITVEQYLKKHDYGNS